MSVRIDETAAADLASAAAKRRSRQGSETRQRTEQLKLSLLPVERKALEEAAARNGFNGTLQQFILHKLAGELELATA